MERDIDIIIVHLKRSGLSCSNLIPLDRSTILGNPYSHLPKSKAKYRTKTVEEAIDGFVGWIKKQVRDRTPEGVAFISLYHYCKNLKGTIHFGCWCMDELRPSQKDHGCHCVEIRAIFMRRYHREKGI